VILWRHIKSEGEYWEVGRGLMGSLPVVIYAARLEGRVWVRAADLFDDGRFGVVAHSEGSYPATYPLPATFEADLSEVFVLREGDEFIVIPKAEYVEEG